MSIVSNNIKYLRRLNGLTQEQFARKIAIKRSLLGAYEEARANPNLTNLKNMAAAFGISVDNLLKNDLRKVRETPDLSLPLNASRPMTVSHSGASQNAPIPRLAAFSEPQPLSKIIEQYQPPKPEIRTVSRQVNLKPINGEAPAPRSQAEPVVAKQNTPEVPAQPAPSIFKAPDIQSGIQVPAFNNQYQPGHAAGMGDLPYPTIQWVAKNRQQEYVSNFQNPGYLAQLPSFQLPNLPQGYYRGFESAGHDFQYPGALLIGTFVRNWYEITDGKSYIFVLKNEGIVYRKAFNQVQHSGSLLLTSDMAAIADRRVALQDVYEVWEIVSFVSNELPSPNASLGRIQELVDELTRELAQYRQS